MKFELVRTLDHLYMVPRTLAPEADDASRTVRGRNASPERVSAEGKLNATKRQATRPAFCIAIMDSSRLDGPSNPSYCGWGSR